MKQVTGHVYPTTPLAHAVWRFIFQYVGIYPLPVVFSTDVGVYQSKRLHGSDVIYITVTIMSQ